MERPVALASGNQVDLEDLPEEIRQVFPKPVVNEEMVQPLSEIEKEYILAVLDLNDGTRPDPDRRTAPNRFGYPLSKTQEIR